MAPKKTYDQTMKALQDMPAIQALKAERQAEREAVGKPPIEGPYEAVNIIVDCPICRHRFGFINQRQAQLKIADHRRALIAYVSRALHKFMN
jgi:hypothetical protein